MESNRTTSSILLPTLIVGLTALLVFTSTLSFFPMPGESAAMLVRYGGMDPLPTAYHPLYALVTQVFSTLPMGTLSFRIGIVSTLCGAACVGILFVMVANVRYWGIHDDEAPHLPMVAGLPAAAYLLVATPFWASANRAHPVLLHLTLIMLALALLQRYAQDAERRSLAVAAFLFGLLLLEWAGTVLILPFAIAAMVLYLHANDELRGECLLRPLLFFTVGVVTFIGLFYARLAWATANLIDPPSLQLGPALLTLMGEHLFLIQREFSGVDGVLIAFGSIVPWLVAMVCARQEGEPEASSGGLMLHLVLTLLCMILLFLGTVSPGMLNDLHSLAAVPPVVAIAAVFGYVTGYWYILADRAWADQPARVRKCLAGIGVLVAALMLTSARVNTERTSTRAAEATHLWASALLSPLPPDSVIIAPANEHDILVLTAHDQARPIASINLTRTADPAYRSWVAGTLAPHDLGDLAEQNLPRFIEAWTWHPEYPAGRLLTTGDPTLFEHSGRAVQSALGNHRVASNEADALGLPRLPPAGEHRVPTLPPKRSAPDFLQAGDWRDRPTREASATGGEAPFVRAGRHFQPAFTGYRDVADPASVWSEELIPQHQAFWESVVPALRSYRAIPGFPGAFCRSLVHKASRTANDLALLARSHGHYNEAHLALQAARTMHFNNHHAAANQFFLLSQTGQPEEAAATWTAVDTLVNADAPPQRRSPDGELLGASRLRTFADIRGGSRERLPDTLPFRDALAAFVTDDASALEMMGGELTREHATDPDAWLLAGLIAADQQDTNAFAECTTRLVELNTDPTPLLVAAARQATARDDIAWARHLIQDALLRQPASIEVLETIAGIELVAASPDSQPTYLHRLVSLDPDNAKGHFALGARLLVDGDRSRARQELLLAADLGSEPRATLLAALLTDQPDGPVRATTADLALQCIDAQVDDPNYWSTLQGLFHRMQFSGAAAYAAGQAERSLPGTPSSLAYARLIEAAQPVQTIDVAAVAADPIPPEPAPRPAAEDADLRSVLDRVMNPTVTPSPPEASTEPPPPTTPPTAADLDDEQAPVPLVW